MESTEYFWYLSYGSNILKERFLCYIQGGQPEGSEKNYEGCTDKSLPIKENFVDLNYELYFALSSKSWQNGGVAFITSTQVEDNPTKAVMYLITKQQFIDVLKQEIGKDEIPEIDFKVITPESPSVFIKGVKYGKILSFGEYENYPVFTFTHKEDLKIFTKPSSQYLKAIIKGMADSFKLSREDVFKYLKTKKGIEGNYTDAELRQMIEDCDLWFKEFSKEYKLSKKDVKREDLLKSIEEIEKNNTDLRFQTHDIIPEDLIPEYARFSQIADENTKGILEKGQRSNMTEEYIRTVYNKRESNKIYSDVIVLNDKDKVVGKLNAWGHRGGGFYNIFHLYVDDNYRGRKIGKALLLKTMLFAIDNMEGLTHFELQTHKSNPRTQKMISDLKFVEQKS